LNGKRPAAERFVTTSIEMPNSNSGENRKAPRKRPPALRTTHRVKRAEWHWFDHPEMQSRIAGAESDLAEGRYTRFASPEEYLEYLEGQE
jgi:hypothetical protein